MPILNIAQPEIIEIEQGLRLKKFDGVDKKMLEGYQDPVVYQNSEGIFDESKIPDYDYIKAMCEYLDNAGEFYYIQVFENSEYVSIGDVTVKPENPPLPSGRKNIVVWESAKKS